MVSDAKEKAALFNDYFVTQSRVNDTDATLPNLEVFQSCITLSNISTSEYEVKKLLQNVDTSKACGADGVGNALLIRQALIILHVLFLDLLINHFLWVFSL